MALFCFMVHALEGQGNSGRATPSRDVAHPDSHAPGRPLLLVKVVVARYYKSFTAALVPLGRTIFTLGFVLVASSAGPYLFRKAVVKEVSLETVNMGGVKIDLQSSEAPTQKRCSRCQGARRDARG